MKALKGATTKLEKRVQAMINNRTEVEYGPASVLQDLFYGGCQSGIIGELVYYHDTVKFYKLYKSEINSMLKNTLSDCGFTSPTDLFGDKWHADDIFAEDTHNQNLLAWFGFEETARVLAGRNGIEV